MKKKRYYFLPFVDHILAVLVSLLFSLFFASWFSYQPFGIIMGIVMTLVMCGFIYSRMWKLSRKNTRYGWGFTMKDGVRFLLPLVIFNAVLVFVYALAAWGILPLQDTVLNSYYRFPDNAPRELVHITGLDGFTMIFRLWFYYFSAFSQKTHLWLYALAPILTFVSGIIGFRLGSENKEVLEGYIKVSDKIKEKFNE